MRNLVLALLSGALFGGGLAVSGMTSPARVRGFLDLFGAWDPTLMFVMGSALAVMAVAWRIKARMARPVLTEAFVMPTRRDLDARLVGGSVLFGIGWGMAGICPGPGFAMLALVPGDAVVFLAGLFVGMLVFRQTAQPRTSDVGLVTS